MPRPSASSTQTANSLDQALGAFAPRLPLAVALSGGADSTALLIACAARWPGQVAAIHVHHGLQPAADGFLAHCRTLCAGLQVPLSVQRVDARHAPGQSPEDAARRARYAALDAAVAVPIGGLACASVALAQHADDQVETVLLALSRGAGVPGLAAMPAHWQRGGVDFHRPLLALPGAEIRRWLAARGAAFVEDPSNRDPAYTRNRIRHGVLPALEAAFPAIRATVARSARHAAQAQQVLDAMAGIDLTQVAAGAQLQLAALRALPRARQANLLRHWLRAVHRTTARAAQLDALLDQIAACTTRGHRIRLRVGDGMAERRGPHLAWYNPAADPAPAD